jgi:LysM repeat protein
VYPHLKIWRPLAAVGALVTAAVLAVSSVTVEVGDTLSEIAAANDVTVAELIVWNDIRDPDLIFAGTSLVVSAPEGATVAPAGTHVVTAGETLSAIAARFGTTVARLVRTNDLADPDRITVGERLDLSDPGGSSTITAPPTTATHTVAAGDTLSAIAARYGVKIGVLARDNGITDPDRIREGMTLTIGAPAPADTPPTTTVPSTTVPPATVPPTTVPPTTSAAPAPTTPVTTSTMPTPVTTPPSRRDGEVLLVPLFAKWSDVYNVPQGLLEAIAWKESDWRSDAVGPAGHLGITQLSPETVDLIEGGLLGRDMDPLDPEEGIQLAARYLRYLLDRTDTEREATAAWVQGLSSVQREGVTTVGAGYADDIEEIRTQRR